MVTGSSLPYSSGRIKEKGMSDFRYPFWFQCTSGYFNGIMTPSLKPLSSNRCG